MTICWFIAHVQKFLLFIINSNESNEKGAWRQDDSSYLSLRILYTTLCFELLIATIKFTIRFFPWNSILESFRSLIRDTKSQIMISLLLFYKTSATKSNFCTSQYFKKPQKIPLKKVPWKPVKSLGEAYVFDTDAASKSQRWIWSSSRMMSLLFCSLEVTNVSLSSTSYALDWSRFLFTISHCSSPFFSQSETSERLKVESGTDMHESALFAAILLATGFGLNSKK